ncbi:MAG: Asp-tRNA(Asn)/Glu-tRNA(Gln) amidotransferase subunit GatB [bacterium]
MSVDTAQRGLEPVIGLEIHVRLQTRTKMFCGCTNRYGGEPNSRICPVCLGLPGALPVPNREAVHMAVRAALALGCRVNGSSLFERKNYFYPDLPKGYQISQYRHPLAKGGGLDFSGPGGPARAGIVRLHLEEDAGKSIHAGDRTLVDLNRCGTPLVEIVTGPDFREPGAARAFLTALRRLVRWIGVSDGNMEEGSLRCDANVSLRPAGSDALGPRTEVKNMNSFKAVEEALSAEIDRQAGVVSSGASVEPATMLWDEEERSARVMRAKESAPDYRYFPEPDLLPLLVTAEAVRDERSGLPEFPGERARRFSEVWGLDADTAAVLTDSRPTADYFEETVNSGAAPEEAASWVAGEVLRLRKGRAGGAAPGTLARLLERVAGERVSRTAAKEVFGRLWEEGGGPEDVDRLIEEMGLQQLSDEDALREEVGGVLARHPEEAAEWRRGREELTGFFIGEVMRATGGAADPHRTRKVLEDVRREGRA